jgi:hypothetical protein
MTEPKLTSEASWQPHTNLISHAGLPLTVDADFFIKISDTSITVDTYMSLQTVKDIFPISGKK